MRRIRWDSQRGVAMVTVLFLGAGMTVLASAAAFTTVREFRASNDDRKAAEAISIAEAGIDRMLVHLKSGLITFKTLNTAGCGTYPPITLPQGVVGNGTFTVSLTVFDHLATGASRFPPAACASRPSTPNHGGIEEGDDDTYYVITSTGRHPDATRTLQQVVAMRPVRLPVGIYARDISVQSRNHPFPNISMVSETTILNRGNLSFRGTDSYYQVQDFFSGVSGLTATSPVPAAAHAAGYIQTRNAIYEFANATKNCAANGTTDGAVADHSLWDSDGSSGSGAITSGCAGEYPVTTYPHSSKFTSDQLSRFARPELSAEDHQVLKEAAKVYGVYCSLPGIPPTIGDTAGAFCFKENTSQGASFDHAGMIEDVTTRRNSFVAYIEFRGGNVATNNISDPFSVWGCDDTDNVAPDTNQSVVVIVRNGGVDYTGAAGEMVNGAFIIDGDWQVVGGYRFNGTIISGGNVHFHSSSQNFTMDTCWVENMPGPFLQPIPRHWSEIDR